MKKAVFLFFVAFITQVYAQVPDGVNFKETVFKFGKIKQHVPATHVFSYTNTGNKPLVIEFANAECGCTKPEYSQSALPKGKSTTIKVTYNAENPGIFSKKVNVKFAGVQLPVVLTIEGDVIPAETAKKS